MRCISTGKVCQNNDSMIILFASSIILVLKDARYMRVVDSDSCPMPSLMTASGMFLLLAMLAHEWRATYMVKGMSISSLLLSAFRLWLLLWEAYIYCLRSSKQLSGLIIGSRKEDREESYLSTISCMHLSQRMLMRCFVFLRRYDNIPSVRSFFLRYAMSTNDMPRV